MAVVSSLPRKCGPRNSSKPDQSTPAHQGACSTHLHAGFSTSRRASSWRTTTSPRCWKRWAYFVRRKTTTKHEPALHGFDSCRTSAAPRPPWAPTTAHAGHGALLRAVREGGGALSGGESIVLSFDPHPRVTLGRAEGCSCSRRSREKALLCSNGPASTTWSSFRSTRHSAASRPTLSSVTPLIGRLGIEALVVGYDYRFRPHDQRGDTGCLDRPHRNRTARGCGSPNTPLKRGQGKAPRYCAQPHRPRRPRGAAPPGSSIPADRKRRLRTRDPHRRKPLKLAAAPRPRYSRRRGVARHRSNLTVRRHRRAAFSSKPQDLPVLGTDRHRFRIMIAYDCKIRVWYEHILTRWKASSTTPNYVCYCRSRTQRIPSPAVRRYPRAEVERRGIMMLTHPRSTLERKYLRPARFWATPARTAHRAHDELPLVRLAFPAMRSTTNANLSCSPHRFTDRHWRLPSTATRAAVPLAEWFLELLAPHWTAQQASAVGG